MQYRYASIVIFFQDRQSPNLNTDPQGTWKKFVGKKKENEERISDKFDKLVFLIFVLKNLIKKENYEFQKKKQKHKEHVLINNINMIELLLSMSIRRMFFF